MNPTFQHDVLVIGSGAAGLTVALKLGDKLNVAVLCKGSVSGGSTYYAQGGVAAVLDSSDTVDAHVRDTLTAGAGLCDENSVRFTIERSKRSIEWLIQQGVPFTENENTETEYHLTKEGGHSHRRIIHQADTTGRAISNTLVTRAKEHPNIEFFEQRTAIDLITREKLGIKGRGCFGAYVLNCDTEHVELFRARFVVIASGGASKVYLYTSNPDGACGDGIAMAWRAGCRVANMEFNQFHPTCLYHPHAKSFLLSEALRGEGAKLLLPDGSRFMHKFDHRGELAPRDIVARAIDHEIKRLGCDCLYLDISHKPKDFIQNHFPSIYKRCLSFGYDLTEQPIPIVPAAHYTCGGIVTDLRGRTDVQQLYAIGETSYTGFHGANRLASNSLLECFVFAEAAAEDILDQLEYVPAISVAPEWDESLVTDSDEDVVISHNWDELRRFMWDYVGIVRTDKRLQRAEHRANLLQSEIAEYYSNYKVSNDLIELRNLVMVAQLIIRSALSRKESRGLHYTLDYPQTAKATKPTLLTPENYSD
ncbi:MAG: L-aspartate oxidase [Pseudomonadales bacterium]|nr:L-aspartate oxidase [Pseudomonadales bacterium]